MLNEIATMIRPSVFGRIWRRRIFGVGIPSARAASTNSFSFSESTCPRTRRARPVQLISASAVKISSRPWKALPNHVSRKATVSVMMKSRSGNEAIISVKRISKLSTQPPEKPDTSPIATPIARIINCGTTPTISETRVA